MFKMQWSSEAEEEPAGQPGRNRYYTLSEVSCVCHKPIAFSSMLFISYVDRLHIYLLNLDINPNGSGGPFLGANSGPVNTTADKSGARGTILATKLACV